MSLEGKRLAILAENDYEDMELQYPLYRMREAGAEVVIVGTGSAPEYKGKNGMPIKVDKTASDVAAIDFDGVIIPGGWAPDRMRRYPEVLKFVRDISDTGKLVAAICHAGWVLISADLLKGKTVTCFPNIRDDVMNAGARYVDQEVVRDGNLITSRTPRDLPAFCKEIIAALEEKTVVTVGAGSGSASNS